MQISIQHNTKLKLFHLHDMIQQLLANGIPNQCQHFFFLHTGTSLNSSESYRDRKEESQRLSKIQALFFMLASVSETLCKMCTLKFPFCSFNIEMLPPSLIWCFQICPFTSAYTKAFIISLYFPSHTHTHTFGYAFKICRLEGFLKLANASPNSGLRGVKEMKVF